MGRWVVGRGATRGAEVPSRSGLALALLVAGPLGASAAAQGSNLSGGTVPSRPPRLSTDLPAAARVEAGAELRFRVRAHDPDRDRLDLVLLNPPPGLAFDPLRGARAPAEVEARWRVPSDAPGGRLTLVFEARDARGLSARLSCDVDVLGGADAPVATGDVTGDGVLDVVAGAELADVGGVADAGALYVWAGSAAPGGAPSATLAVPGALAGDELGALGYSGGRAVQLADVTGDGVDDVIALAEHATVGGAQDGALYVFAGGAGLAGAPFPGVTAPRASLAAPDARGLGSVSGQGVLVGDVTGDGVLDLVAGAKNARVGGLGNVGALYVYAGGVALAGTRGPSAVLTVPGASPADFLGLAHGQALQLGDVTGDGVLDVVACAMRADVAGVGGAGAVYVWAGGGVPDAEPSARLAVPGATAGDQLGSQGFHQGVRLADVTHDGVLDVVAGASLADVAGVVDAGALYVFAGGAAMSGLVAPRARLAAPAPGANDRLGPDRDEGFRVADVTGDGRLEVLAASPLADVGGIAEAGLVLVWSVGSSSGPLPPLATLAAGGATLGDRLATRLYLADVTGDRVLDVVTVSSASVGGAAVAGSLHVFAGGGLAGTPAPLATLTVPGARPGDALGGAGLAFADLTRDGTVDVLAVASDADRGARADVGAFHVFAGDGGFFGAMAPRATLAVARARSGERLALVGVADVTGDGAPDVVGRTRRNEPPFLEVGGLVVFDGADGFSGGVPASAHLTLPSFAPNDDLTARLLADVTGDGVLDVVAHAWTGGGAVVDAGALLVYRGGPMRGRTLPAATLVAPLAALGERMALAAVADVTGDGLLDLLGATPWADVAGVADAGALYLFEGSRALPPEPVGATLAVPGAQPDDRLGL